MNVLTLSLFTLLILIPCAQAGWLSEDNYWQCLLDDMHDVKSDTVAAEVIDRCQQRYPFYTRIFINKKRPLLGIKTASECVIARAKNSTSEVAARAIQSACYKLYPEN